MNEQYYQYSINLLSFYKTIAPDMNPNIPSTIKLENDSASLVVDLFGGAITAFQLKENDINPLSFAFSKEQMPVNNKTGTIFQGHFLCLGRWGEPSTGETNAGLPFHGEPANIEWTIKESNNTVLEMGTVAAKEGLQVRRTIVLDQHNPVYAVKELVTNINPLGRLYNMVQHPTLAAPFLNEKTIIDCNALSGFEQAFYKNISSNIIEWPWTKEDRNKSLNLRNPGPSNDSVYSFVIAPEDDYGWITAFSPTHKLLLGYLWKRVHYPWIHLWQHYREDRLQYRGIEFGTAGMHQPFNEILNTATTIFGEKTYAYVDAGETVIKNYFSFSHSIQEGFAGVEKVYFANEELAIKAKDVGDDINIKLTQRLLNELS